MTTILRKSKACEQSFPLRQSLYVLFSQYMYRLCDHTLENFFFLLISSHSRAYQRINDEKTKDEIPLGPLLGKQNIQA